ncbi:acetyl-acetyltransferase protein [Pyrenophora tritici-repentis]|nr:acetyl-acetyltransferase protein [Pyrenophora tritici-repentis]KAF7452265.1 acetyl-acetyltransferase protein [Pyrenophora tritici-repentis]KAI0580763.1 acetyl-acetyltransferase protein [Pyrenophora tritici-repentis]KAI0580956.1 acetyl-acetyltransferase protein [Pyrenophora tritici-repentis]KAI0609056.1 acetyl-acetyltransferase protein [Pyrenophora tritici-repentis]
MSSAAIRTSMRMASRPQQRLASIQRQFSSSSPQRKEFNGNFTTVSATQLGATAIKSALDKSKVPISSIDAVYMGNVLSAGVGQAPARQAAIFAGLPTNIEATTINKVCASGLKAVNIAASTIELGQAEAQVAGGMENMTRVPYYLNRASQQPAFGHQKLQDGLIADGLWDVYNQIHMGNCAENTAKKYQVSRQDQDDYAIETYKRAQQAYKDGLFKDEIVPVTVKSKKGEVVISEDEQYNKLKLDKVATLKPAFDKGPDASVTAANSSPLSDGASALVLGSKEIAQKYGKDSRVLAKVVTYADASLDPIDFPVAPASCVEKLLKQSGLSKNDISIWEFNEAFAAVIKANAKILGLGTENVNPRGGAIALGHALGSSGSRILVTLLHQLEVGQYGAAVICNGGGAASGIIVQRVGADQL